MQTYYVTRQGSRHLYVNFCVQKQTLIELFFFLFSRSSYKMDIPHHTAISLIVFLLYLTTLVENYPFGLSQYRSFDSEPSSFLSQKIAPSSQTNSRKGRRNDKYLGNHFRITLNCMLSNNSKFWCFFQQHGQKR